MIEYRESRISATHNYLANGIMTPGFVLGDPNDPEGFFFLADPVLPGESTPRICSRVFDDGGQMVVEIQWNRIRRNPGNVVQTFIPGGFRVDTPSGDVLLEVWTQHFANGYLTRMKARLFDQEGRLQTEPREEGLRILEEQALFLEAPFNFEKA